MIFPNAQIACSQTFCWRESSNSLKRTGTALAFTTCFVCSELPEAMFVNAHAASNCNDGLEVLKNIIIIIIINNTYEYMNNFFIIEYF